MTEDMVQFIARRLAISIVVMFGTVLLAFFLLSLAPGNAAENILRAERLNDPRLGEVEIFMEKHGLNNTMLKQLGQWFYMLGHGNLGTSFRTNEPVTEEFWARFPATFELAAASMVIACLIAIPIGVLSAVKRNSLLDHGSRIFALWGVSMPNFWMGLLLILIFGVKLGWLPTFGYGGMDHLVLPTVTLAIGMSAILIRLQRTSILEVLNANYVRTARAKGLSERVVIGKHAFRNTLIPMVTVIGIQFAHLLAGVVIVEQIFAWPGIGHFLVDSINAQDYPVVQGFVLMIALFFVICNLLVDVLYAYLDPRIRYERGR